MRVKFYFPMTPANITFVGILVKRMPELKGYDDSLRWAWHSQHTSPYCRLYNSVSYSAEGMTMQSQTPCTAWSQTTRWAWHGELFKSWFLLKWQSDKSYHEWTDLSRGNIFWVRYKKESSINLKLHNVHTVESIKIFELCEYLGKIKAVFWKYFNRCQRPRQKHNKG